MTTMKRIEIVIDAAHTPELVRTLREAGAPGYTLIRDVQGSGDRGDRGGDGLTNVYRNCYIIIAALPEKADAIAEAARPLLERFGGMCLISDALSLNH